MSSSFVPTPLRFSNRNTGRLVRVKAPPRKLNQRQKKQVKRLISIRQEKKFFPFYLHAANVALSASVTDLTSITQGDTALSRDGNAIYLKRIELRYDVVASDTTNQVRILIFQWKNDTDADPPTSAKIIQDEINAPWLFDYNFTERKEFNVLYDRLHSVSAQGPASVSRHIIINPKKYKKEVYFNGTATSGSNKIYLLGISDSGAVSHPTISVYGTITFTDS